jgi:NADH dehydrogenase/NADH:ubiquinone oxidoreductase subunit G
MSRLSPPELAAFAEGAGHISRQAPPADESYEMTADSAAAEAGRCLHCDCRKPESCKLRRYADEYNANPRRYRGPEPREFRKLADAEVVYEPGKCIACGICVRVTRKRQEPLGLTYIGRGFDVRVGVPFNEPLAKGLRTAAAECVKACPTGALAFVKQEERP